MASSAIIHMIGTLALVVVLALVLLHVSATITVIKNTNLRNNYIRIADSISVQILNALYTHENQTIRLTYPIEAGYGEQYNIIIGTGAEIMRMYPQIRVDNPSYIYVAITSPDFTVHVERKIINTTSGSYKISLVQDPYIVGSRLLTYLKIIIIDKSIYIDIIIKGSLK